MTSRSNLAPASIPPEATNEDDVRDYAYHLYLQSGCTPGRDLDNWLEAKACLQSFVPPGQSHARLHYRLAGERPVPPLNEDDIRDYAYHLYVQNGHRNDQCADNWREAIACLQCRIPQATSHIRLHQHLNRSGSL